MAEGSLLKILVTCEEEGVRESLKLILEDDYDVLEAGTGRAALELVGKQPIHLVFLDVKLPDMGGIEMLKQLKELKKDLDVIVLTSVTDVKTVVQAIKLSAYDYIVKPFEPDEIRCIVGKALEKYEGVQEGIVLQEEVSRQRGFAGIIGTSEKMRQNYDIILRVANNMSTVLISGESGTGKELIARAIHRCGTRRNRPFITVNCGAIPENLIESELFGHEKGAFTGATSRRLGKFELAQGGTVFLDEIANLRVDLQGKLLRVLQEREFERIGGSNTIRADVRIIAATNVDIRERIAEGSFREDLFYRVNVVPIHVSPLRERPEDIPLLVEYFINKYNNEFGRNVKKFSEGACSILQDYHWPGNVRELENIIERIVALGQGEYVIMQELPEEILRVRDDGAKDEKEKKPSLREAKDQLERQYICEVLEEAEWNQTEAARMLGIHRNTLINKMESLGIKKEPSPKTG